MASTNLPPLLRIPPELYLEICSHLSLDVLNMRRINHHLRYHIPPLTHKQLLELERDEQAIERDLYVCKFCLMLRPGCMFQDAMISGKKDHFNEHRDARHTRFCLDCGFARVKDPENKTLGGRYSPGTDFKVRGTRWVWCLYCRQLKKGEEAGYWPCLGGCAECCTAGKCCEHCKEAGEELRAIKEAREKDSIRIEGRWMQTTVRLRGVLQVVENEEDDEEDIDWEWNIRDLGMDYEEVGGESWKTVDLEDEGGEKEKAAISDQEDAGEEGEEGRASESISYTGVMRAFHMHQMARLLEEQGK